MVKATAWVSGHQTGDKMEDLQTEEGLADKGNIIKLTTYTVTVAEKAGVAEVVKMDGRTISRTARGTRCKATNASFSASIAL